VAIYRTVCNYISCDTFLPRSKYNVNSRATYCLTCVYKFCVTEWHSARKIHNIKSRNCGLLSYEPCDLNGQHRQFGLVLLLLLSDGQCDNPRMLLHNIHNHVCTRLYGVITQTTLRILTTVSTPNPVPKIIMNWNVHRKVTLGKLNYSTAIYIFTQYLMSHTFLTNCVHCFVLRLKNL
jgi:hypothetical protein